MVNIKRSMALLAFAGALIAGGFAGADEVVLGDPQAQGPEASDFTSFDVVGHDAAFTYLMAVVEPSLAGGMLNVSFGPEPGLPGMLVASVPLQPGPNMIAVPRSPIPGWYTGEVLGRTKSIYEGEPGAN